MKEKKDGRGIKIGVEVAMGSGLCQSEGWEQHVVLPWTIGVVVICDSGGVWILVLGANCTPGGTQRHGVSMRKYCLTK